MGVSTTGFVATNIKDVFFVGKAVDTVLKNLIKVYRQGNFRDENNKFPIIELDSTGEYLVYRFVYRGEHRKLMVFFNCDRDCSEAYVGNKIIWSLEHWGSAEEIVLAICKHFYEVHDGLVFFQPEDTRDDNWIQVEG